VARMRAEKTMTNKEIADYLITNRREMRVRRGRPCPICDHTDWCLCLDDGSAALCRRSDGTGSVKQYGSYGHLHITSSGLSTQTTKLPRLVKKPERTDAELNDVWRPRAEKWRERGRNEINRLAMTLGVGAKALRELGTGWDGKAWTFPEKNGKGLVVGVSRRFEDGAKRCAVGSRRGLTYSNGWRDRKGAVLIVEGASDVASGITLGLAAVGRPSNIGGLKMLSELLSGTKRKVIVVGERDRKADGRWPGMEGCQSIAMGLGKSLRRSVSAKLLPDGAKDLRSWLIGQRVDIYSAVARAKAGQELLRQL